MGFLIPAEVNTIMYINSTIHTRHDDPVPTIVEDTL